MRYLIPHLLFEAAERNSSGVAVVCREVRLTYEQLLDRSQAVAVTLLDLGVQPGDRVGIHLGKSVESIVAVWGIMTAGAVYVPLDTAAPMQRIEFVIRDCDIRYVVTDTRAHRINDHLSTAEITLDGVIGVPDGDMPFPSVDWATVLSRSGQSPPPSPATGMDLSYILYTSGSTGVPKGIMHTHTSALAWADLTTSTYALTSDDVISNYAPLHFDLSTLDLYAGVKAAATMVMIPEEHMVMPASLAALLEVENLTLFYTVPLALVQLAQPGVLKEGSLSSLTRILFGGEPMPVKHLRSLRSRLPHTSFFNVYGPTETNGCVHHLVDEASVATEDAIPIGRPYPNVETSVLDDDDRPVPPGGVGELMVRAPTMMKGYWNRDDLNESAFLYRSRYSGLPDVFHRTGDLVHQEYGGTLYFHGRKDRQMKIRGYRVELDEVESVILSHPWVREAAVFPVRGDDGVTIRAAVILDRATSDALMSIRDHATDLLPGYAMPESIAQRAKFPRTTSGKIDRLSLQKEIEDRGQ